MSTRHGSATFYRRMNREETPDVSWVGTIVGRGELPKAGVEIMLGGPEVKSEIEWSDQVVRVARIVTVAVISVVFATAVVGGALLNCGHGDGGNVAAAKAQIKQFDVALVAYKLKFGELPESMDALLRPPSGGPIINAKQVPLDPWGNPYRYSQLGPDAYTVISLGADGEVGGEDGDADIRSDEMNEEMN